MTPTPKTNPDVEELIAYNRAGCDHPRVAGLVPKDEVEAVRVGDGNLALSGFWARFCADCGQMVPTRPTPAAP